MTVDRVVERRVEVIKEVPVEKIVEKEACSWLGWFRGFTPVHPPVARPSIFKAKAGRMAVIR